jgi:FkbM family methyltransferase
LHDVTLPIGTNRVELPEIHERAHQAVQSGDWEEARRLWEIARDLDPESFWPTYWFATSAAHCGAWREATCLLEALFTRGQEQDVVAYRIAENYCELNDGDSALPYFKFLHRLGKGDAQMMDRLAFWIIRVIAGQSGHPRSVFELDCALLERARAALGTQPTSAVPLLEDLAPRPKTIIEVGAAWGSDTARLLDGDKNTVYAFEPIPDHVAKLQSMFGTRPNFHLFPSAVDVEEGWRWFNVAKPENIGISSLHEFNPNIREEWPLQRAEYQGRVQVMTTRLDTFIEENGIRQIDFLWIDAQGNDFRVLQSLGGYIVCVQEGKCEAAYTVDLYKGVNNSHETITAWLRERGFEVLVVPEGGWNEADVYFKRP